MVRQEMSTVESVPYTMFHLTQDIKKERRFFWLQLREFSPYAQKRQLLPQNPERNADLVRTFLFRGAGTEVQLQAALKDSRATPGFQPIHSNSFQSEIKFLLRICCDSSLFPFVFIKLKITQRSRRIGGVLPGASNRSVISPTLCQLAQHNAYNAHARGSIYATIGQ